MLLQDPLKSGLKDFETDIENCSAWASGPRGVWPTAKARPRGRLGLFQGETGNMTKCHLPWPDKLDIFFLITKSLSKLNTFNLGLVVM